MAGKALPPSLWQRPAVRLAAIALVRVLMREAGLKLTDLVVQRKPRPGARRKPVQAPVLRSEAAPAAVPVCSASPQLVTPAERPLDRAARMAGMGQRGKAIPGAVARHAPLAGPVVVPDGVKVTQCPAGRDTRFTADPAHVGEFTRDWLSRRKGTR